MLRVEVKMKITFEILPYEHKNKYFMQYLIPKNNVNHLLCRNLIVVNLTTQRAIFPLV